MPSTENKEQRDPAALGAAETPSTLGKTEQRTRDTKHCIQLECLEASSAVS